MLCNLYHLPKPEQSHLDMRITRGNSLWVILVFAFMSGYIILFRPLKHCSRSRIFAKKRYSDFILPQENVVNSILSNRTLFNNWPNWTSVHALQPWRAVEGSKSDQTGDGERKRLPTVICIGAKKCGTTAMQQFMTAHPNFKTSYDELHFFDSKNYYFGFDHYRNQMPYSRPRDIVFEKSPRYLVAPLVPERIREWNPDIKLIVNLCDPVSRAFSDYNYMIRRDPRYRWNWIRQFKTFEDHINSGISDISKIEEDPLETLGYATFDSFVRNSWNERTYQLSSLTVGLYYYHLKEWYNYFSPEQIHVFDGDKFIRSPYKEIKKLERFLGLSDYITEDMFYYDHDKKFYCVKNKPCLEGAKGTTRQFGAVEMDDTIRDKLRRFFKPYNEKLFKLLRREFDWQ